MTDCINCGLALSSADEIMGRELCDRCTIDPELTEAVASIRRCIIVTDREAEQLAVEMIVLRGAGQ